MKCIECNKNINNEKEQQEYLNNSPELPMCESCTYTFNQENYLASST